VDSLVINGSMTYESIEIWEHRVQFYKRLYAKQLTTKIGLPLVSSIDGDKSYLLEWDFEENEVLEVVRDLNSDKDPSLDSFSLAFFKKQLHSQRKFEKKKLMQLLSPLCRKRPMLWTLRNFGLLD
jgi:hypothetical protein